MAETDSISAKKTSRVPDEFLQGASPIERRIIHKLDIAEQVNDDLMRQVLQVKEQAILTNGRVTALEKKSVATEKVLGDVKKAKALALWIWSGIGAAVVSLLNKFAAKWFVIVALCLIERS